MVDSQPKKISNGMDLFLVDFGNANTRIVKNLLEEKNWKKFPKTFSSNYFLFVEEYWKKQYRLFKLHDGAILIFIFMVM